LLDQLPGAVAVLVAAEAAPVAGLVERPALGEPPVGDADQQRPKCEASMSAYINACSARTS
ncbi:hypothetical protein D6833_00765, partial [Candidatus Parcubacteria bacterium]